jgi:hypothetical protein
LDDAESVELPLRLSDNVVDREQQVMRAKNNAYDQGEHSGKEEGPTQTS